MRFNLFFFVRTYICGGPFSPICYHQNDVRYFTFEYVVIAIGI